MNKGKRINWGMIIAGTLLAALFFGACQQPVVSGKDDKDPEVQGTTGEILLVLGDEVASRTLFPDIDMNTASYRITGSGPDGGAFDFVTTETMERIDDLTYGDWTITVEALNAADAVIGRGSAVATVEIGETAAVAITVEALSGFGTLTLDVSWPAADVFLPAIQASLMPISGVERTLDFTVDKDAGTAVFSAADVEAGYYTLTLKLTDRGQLVMGAVELVWMAEGAETAGTFAFTDVNDAQGSVDITIEPGMTEPFPVTINGAPSTLAEDELAFLSTTIPAEVGPCLTFWYLNGLCRSTDAEWSFAGADYGPGFYRLDVVMISADFTLGGSASMMMEITEDTTAPTIVSITPADGAVDVSLTDPITIVFSDSMDADTLNATSISLTAGGTPVAATLSLSEGQKTVTLSPDAGLGWLTEYEVSVDDTVADLAGNGLVASQTVSFHTRNKVNWTRLLGVYGSQTEGKGISTDSYGNSYITGDTRYGNLDGQILTGTVDMFVSKYSSDGTKQWTRLLGVSGSSTNGFGISTDSDGNSYITGSTGGNLDGQTLTGTVDMFVTKYSNDGTKQWTRLLGNPGSTTFGKGISIDSDGNSYITGFTEWNLDGQTLTGTQDMFVTKYSNDGTKQWTHLLGVSGAYTYGRGISTDSDGNSYITGITNGNLDGQTLTGSSDTFVSKYLSDGTKQWTRLLGVSGSQTEGRGISTDSDGNSYITGVTNGNLDGQALTGGYDMFVSKYSSDGTKQWTRLLGASGFNTRGNGINTDSDGNSYITGRSSGNLDGQTLTGTNDMFVTKYSNDGTKQWTRLLGVYPSLTEGNGISTNSDGNSYITGVTYGHLDGQTLTGSPDMFVTSVSGD